LVDHRGAIHHLGVGLRWSLEAEAAVAIEDKGMRHRSAARWTYDHPDAPAVVVSEDGPVSVFRQGRALTKCVGAPRVELPEATASWAPGAARRRPRQPPWAATQARTRPGSAPRSRTRLRRPVCPATTATSAGRRPSSSARSRSRAALARPRSGGAATLTFRASPWVPATPGREAPGWTWTVSRTLPSSATSTLATPEATPGRPAAAYPKACEVSVTTATSRDRAASTPVVRRSGAAGSVTTSS